MTKIQSQKMFSNCDMVIFSSEFCTFRFFLYDSVTNKARKLEVVVSNLIKKKIPRSPSVCVGWRSFLSLSLSRFISSAPSLSLLNSFVDIALQRLLCGLRSWYITLNSRPFNQGKANLTKEWLGTDKANCSPVVWEQFARRYRVRF